MRSARGTPELLPHVPSEITRSVTYERRQATERIGPALLGAFAFVAGRGGAPTSSALADAVEGSGRYTIGVLLEADADLNQRHADGMTRKLRWAP